VPELPEVETIARGVHQRVRHAQIVSAWFSRYREPMKTSPGQQQSALTGAWFLSVRRVGKHIVCDLATQPPTPDSSPTHQWIVHLGMTGRLVVTHADQPVVPHTHARLTLHDAREIRFVDARRFGRLQLLDLKKTPAFRGPGSEPLTIDADSFAQLFRSRQVAIKAALLNQSLLHGIGNIYADESLFRAGIRPRRIAASLSRPQLERLRISLQQVLQHAIALGGSSVSDYVDANGVKGFFQLEHCVYARQAMPCRVCGQPIQRIVLAGRGTHFCRQCQH
jgi:formamidopyrimidine-DNA glycosylase